MKKKSRLISIVIPVLNEAENLPALYSQLSSVLKTLKCDFEVIFIDDGSTDATFTFASDFSRSDKRVKVISFSRTFGHQAALMAGLEFARGDAVITMDGDLQHPPKLIPELLKHWENGYDVVLTIRKETKGASSFKLATARAFYSLLNRIGNIQIPVNSADFRLLSRRVIEQINQLGERAIFLRGLVQWVGFRQASVEYDAEPRHAGKTKYNLRKMLGFAIDGITSFSYAPLVLALYFGFLVSALSFSYGMYAIYIKLFTDQSIPGWASILVAVLFLGGIQLVTIGIIGLYLGKLFEETKRRPRYIIRSQIGEFLPKV